MDKVEELIYQQMSKSYEEKMKELPPPPAGYWYKPTLKDARLEGENYIVDMELHLAPIIQPSFED